MKVVCIKDNPQDPKLPQVKKGRVYNVINTHLSGGNVYYEFIEIGGSAYYLASAFIEIEEDQIDETELVKERLVETNQ